MIARLSYVMCDRCGNPAQECDDAREAREAAKREGFIRIWVNGRLQDICGVCSTQEERDDA